MSDALKMATIPAGSLFTVSTGEYSDYDVKGVFRAVADIDPNALRDEWIAAHMDQADDYCFDYSAFMGDAVRRGLLEAVPCFEWHQCDYSRADEMSLSGPGEWAL